MAGKTPVSEVIGRSLAWWVDLACRRPLAVCTITLAAAAYLVVYSAGHLGINTDTARMISERLPWRQTYLEYKRAFPEYFGEIAVVIEGQTPDLAQGARDALYGELETGKNGLFKSVYAPGSGPFFERNGLLYLKTEKLYDLADSLAEIQPFMGKLIQDQSLTGLFSMMEDAMEAVIDGEEVELAPVFEKLSEAFRARADGRFYQVSWQELMLGRDSTFDERRRFIIVRPSLDFTELFPGEAAIREIRGIAQGLGLVEERGVRVRLTGSVALGYEELKSVMLGAETAGVASFLLVAALLLAALRSVRLTAASLVSLLAGLAATAAFAAATAGDLNLISMAFAVLYIGLGIDYAIHFCLRYRELITRGEGHREALKNAAGGVGASLVLCAVTTSAGFYAFIPTAYSGVSELGLISGTGMFISLFITLTLLPALLSLMPLAPPSARKDSGGLRARLFLRLSDAPVRYRRVIWVIVIGAGFASMILIPRVRFDRDPMGLRDPESESVAVYSDLMQESETPPLNIALVKPGLREAEDAAERLERLDAVDKAVSIMDFIPKDQDEKLAIIEEISLLLGPELDLPGRPARNEPAGLDEKLASLEGFVANLREFAGQANPQDAQNSRNLLSEAAWFDGRLKARGASEKGRMLDELEKSLLGSLPERLRELRASLTAARVGLDDLPGELLDHWISEKGEYLVQVYPREDISGNRALEEFVGEVRSVEPNATGMPVFILRAGDAVVGAFEQAFLLAFIFICVILYAILRNITDTALVLFPLLLAGILTGAATVVFSIPFNFANIIALPLLLGIGVDNGIHMVNRARAVKTDEHLLATSTTRAIFFSTFTTIASFGTLAFSRHRGVASMGQILAIGLILALLCTVVALPSLLAITGKGEGGT